MFNWPAKKLHSSSRASGPHYEPIIDLPALVPEKTGTYYNKAKYF